MTETRADFEKVWATLELEKTLKVSPDKTLVPPDSIERVRDAHVTLPPLFSVEDRPQLTIESQIGSGGMGVINAARQTALRRTVAVKQLRDERRNDRAALELMREGWLVGGLEHPNIVPVYMLGEDDHGDPALVMKRIEGVTWSSILNKTTAEVGPRPGDDPLAWHLEILIDVSNAVHYAHSRGIIHRDLKPDNVMVGAFGEVYLLDWGIAVSMNGADDNPLPRAKDANSIAGTPAYIAPEMTVADGSLLGPHTDIYLLGAILHHILTGEPPHLGDNVFEMMLSSYTGGEREYPNAPPALAEVCRKAMAKDPKDRYQSAEEFRDGIRDFLRLREANALFDVGRSEVKSMMAAIEAGKDVDVYRHHEKAKFAFETALLRLDEDERVQTAMREATEALLDFALSIEDVTTARRVADDVYGDANHEVFQKIEALEDRLEERKEKAAGFEQMQADIDRTVSAGWRAISLGFVSVSYFGVVLTDIFIVPVPQIIIPTVVSLLTVIGFLILRTQRDKLMANQVGWRLSWTFGAAVAGVCIIHLGGMSIGMTNQQMVFADLVTLGLMGAAAAISIEDRIWIAVAFYIPAAFLVLYLPDRWAISVLFGAASVVNTLLGINAYLIYRGARQESPNAAS